MRKIFIVLLILVMMLVSACAKDNDKISKAVEGATDNIDNENSNRKPVMAPNFELKDMEGNNLKLSDFTGKKVMLNFWAEWCPFCVQEMPDLMKLQKKHENDLVIIFINVGDSEDVVKKFIEDKDFYGTVVLDLKKEVADIYGVNNLPTTFAINEKGEMITYWKGMMEYDTMEQMYKIIE